jgi:sec-independent protein translocase protein TatA
MGFLGIGTGEIVLILVLAIIILGPGKISEVAKTLGRTLRAIKKASADLSTAVTREMETPSDNPSPPQSKEAKTAVTPLATSEQPTSSKVDQSNKPGEASATK